MGPLIVPERRCQRPGRVHAAARVRADGESESGHRQSESDWHRVGVFRVPAVPDGARDQHQYSRGNALEKEALDSGQLRVQLGHAKHVRLVRAFARHPTRWSHHLQRVSFFFQSFRYDITFSRIFFDYENDRIDGLYESREKSLLFKLGC